MILRVRKSKIKLRLVEVNKKGFFGKAFQKLSSNMTSLLLLCLTLLFSTETIADTSEEDEINSLSSRQRNILAQAPLYVPYEGLNAYSLRKF